MLRLGLGILVAGVVAVILLSGRQTSTEIVQTSNGPIRGEELIFEGTRYMAFKGIPYAAPPVGGLRFKDPQPPVEWTDVRDARAYGKICHQARKTMESSEDCLSLNVFTPSLSESGSKPVLVWIHGGAFYIGDGTDKLYGVQYLVQEDIVVVTINYRLGPLGFLSTNTSDAYGNWGLKDQVAALKWVKYNIANFGGDPNKVTIYGESAGGASVHLHMLSPLSKGLFHRIISSSGSAMNTWAVKTPEQSSRFSIDLAKRLGAPDAELTVPAKRVQFLRTADPEAMCEQATKVAGEEDLKNPLSGPIPFTPVIEQPGIQGAFLTEDPKKLLLEGRFTKVPIMMGVTDLEGGGLSRRRKPETLREIESNVCVILPDALKNSIKERSECAKLAGEIRDVYFEGKSFDSSLLGLAYLCGDLFMTTEIHEAQRLHAWLSTKEAPIYNYIFAFDGKWNFIKHSSNITLPGAAHMDDLGYVFIPTLPVIADRNLPPTSPEVITKNRMVRLISNFVKYGDPTPSLSDLIPVKWEPATAEASKTMVIGSELKMENEFLKTRMDLWDRWYKEYTGSPLFV